MIIGAHTIIYSRDPEADRAFFRDVLGFKSIDIGGGWLLFALPPSESAFHPSDKNDVHELYLICDDVATEMKALEEKGVECTGVREERWGSLTQIPLPGGGHIGLYQSKHETALALRSDE